MQDIFCDEPEEPRKSYGSSQPKQNQPDDVLTYLMNRHATLYGEENRTFFSKENRQVIAKYVASTRLPYTHLLSFIFREMPDTKIFTNMLTGKGWPGKFENYVDTLNLPVEVYQLKSPHALPCWADYQTFLSCMQSFVKDGKSPALLIKNFVYSQRLSNLTLNYIYKNLDIYDEFLDSHFRQIQTEMVYPYEDVSEDLDFILQHYAN